jgi:2-dehydropantoate 2-reductase
MRWVIVGAGAVGGVVGGRLAAAGTNVVLVARGAHLDALRSNGLVLRSPTGEQTLRIPVAGSPAEVGWRPGDALVLAVKSMDTADVLQALPPETGPDTPVVCLQNGVANERAALRRFPDVYGVCVMLPASHLEPGVVVAHSATAPGILDVGRFPHGVDATAEALAADLTAAGFASVARPDVMRAKYRKLLSNLGNAVEALCGRVDGLDEAVAPLVAEGEAALRAAGIDAVTDEDDTRRRAGIMKVGPRDGGSTWQSLARGTGSVEADYLNGEIVLLGRLHGVPTPANALAQRLVRQAAHDRTAPGRLTPEAFLAEVRS